MPTQDSDITDITDLLVAWGEGDEDALVKLAPLVYDRLRRMAGSFLRSERSDHTLQTTALVHDAYLRLVQQNRVAWRDRSHFLALAGQMMRRILVDHARKYAYQKHGAGVDRVPLEMAENFALERPEELIALDQALVDLGSRDADLVRVVELRFFGGLSQEEAAEVLGISVSTATRRLRAAKAWLHDYLSGCEAIDLGSTAGTIPGN